MDTNRKIIYNHKTIQDVDKKVVPEIYEYLMNDKDKLKLIKQTNRKNTAVYYYNFEGDGYYIKHFYFRKWSYSLKEIIGNPIGLTSYRKSVRMLAHDIKVATPVSAITYGGTAFKRDSIFITRELEKSVLINDLIKGNQIMDIPDDKLEDLVVQMAGIWASLLNNNFIHKDPNANNFMIVDLDGDAEIYLIDIADVFDLPVGTEYFKIHALARFFGKFVKAFIQSGAEFDLEYLDIFEKRFIEKYEFKGSKEKFIARVKELARKKYKWRLDRDRS